MSDFPVGEYPAVPTMPRVCAEMDALKRRLEDKTAEYDNIFPMLRDAGTLVAKLTTELQQFRDALDEARDGWNEAEDAREELAIRETELIQELIVRTSERDRARNERDDVRATMPRGLG